MCFPSLGASRKKLGNKTRAFYDPQEVGVTPLAGPSIFSDNTLRRLTRSSQRLKLVVDNRGLPRTTTHYGLGRPTGGLSTGRSPYLFLSNTLLPKDIRSHRAVPHGHSKPGLHTPWRLDLSTSLHVSAHPARMSNVVVAQRLRTVKTAIPIWTSSYIKSRDDGILAPPQDDLSAGTSRPPQKNQIDDQQSLE
jgi:hypothetical protein